jgi:hypothetical protein
VIKIEVEIVILLYCWDVTIFLCNMYNNCVWGNRLYPHVTCMSKIKENLSKCYTYNNNLHNKVNLQIILPFLIYVPELAAYCMKRKRNIVTSQQYKRMTISTSIFITQNLSQSLSWIYIWIHNFSAFTKNAWRWTFSRFHRFCFQMVSFFLWYYVQF